VNLLDSDEMKSFKSHQSWSTACHDFSCRLGAGANNRPLRERLGPIEFGEHLGDCSWFRPVNAGVLAGWRQPTQDKSENIATFQNTGTTP
jgi:hypothetical protein